MRIPVNVHFSTARTLQCTPTGGTANKDAATTDSAVTGLKALGVRELAYKLCFMACSTSVCRQPLHSEDVHP